MAIPSIVNWLNNEIKEGSADSALYVAELANHPDFIFIGFCKIAEVTSLESNPHIERIRYLTSADPEIYEQRKQIPLQDCWLAEQFLLLQLSEYKEIISELRDSGWENYTETIKLPDSGASRFIEWIGETSQRIFCNPEQGHRLCLDCLVTTSRQRLLYEKVKQQWSNKARI